MCYNSSTDRSPCCTAASIRILFLCLWTQRRNAEARKQTSVVDGAVFRAVWSGLATISREAKREGGGQTPPPFAKDEPFWRGPRPVPRALHCKHDGVRNQCHMRLVGDFLNRGPMRRPQRQSVEKGANSCAQEKKERKKKKETHMHARYPVCPHMHARVRTGGPVASPTSGPG